MYLRLVLLVLVGLATFGRQVSSDIDSTSSSTTPSVESLICLPNRTETCSTSTEAYSSSSSTSPSSSFPSFDRLLTEMEILSQKLRMDAIVKELNEIGARFNRLPPLPDPFSEYRLYGRVSALEGSGCGQDRVQCGARTRAQCLSDLFVCDGIVDCINGRDEDPHICSEEPVKIGSTYVGFSFWQTCLPRKPHRSIIVLTRSRRIPEFKARVWLKALFIHHVGDDILTHHMTGYFNFARRQIVLLPVQMTDREFGVQCLFNRGDHDHLDCKIVQPVSFTQCGFITMERL